MEHKQYTRTIRIPVHHGITKEKLHSIDKLTARLTHATRLFSKIIDKTGNKTRTSLAPYEKQIARKTKLSSGFIQQCKDKAIWAWKAYHKEHSLWKSKLKRARKGTKWHKKLQKREPQKPFSSSRNKIPVRLDYRTITLKTDKPLRGSMIKPLKEETTLTRLWADISTLKKNNKIMIPLNPARYHLNKLKKAENISDAEIIKKKNKYYIYMTCTYSIPIQPIESVRAIDLGITRPITTVLLKPDNSLSKNSFLTINGKQMKHRVSRYNKLMAKLQKLKKWKKLRKVRVRRTNFIEDSERKLAELIAKESNNCLVALGNPKRLKYRTYKGNGKRSLRRKLQQWRYNKLVNYIRQSCEEKGIKITTVSEAGTSSICSHCNSNNTKRPYNNSWSLIKCNSCNIMLNADVNAAVNIGKGLMGKQALFRQGASDEHARTADDCLQPGTSAEAHSFALSQDAQGFSPE